jgi:2-succinyl-5-enolpyruvyl-6-hydroxy-3-cyclohexene-1-carboxylate synthase
VNICFDEPLVDDAVPDLALRPAAVTLAPPAADPEPITALLAGARRPLLLLGPLDPTDRAGARAFARWCGAPLYAEPACGLREDPELTDLALTSGEGILREAACDAVLRVGAVPTVRLWRDLEGTLSRVPVCSVARTPFPGLTRGALVRGAVGASLEAAARGATPPVLDTAWRDALLARDRRRRAALEGALGAEPRAEPALVRALSDVVPAGAAIYLGNSLPIREWDLAARREPRGWEVAVSRGANGIDGQLSTFLGLCGPEREHWAIVGDLTALYDLAAPWVLPQLRSGPLRVVVINNGGGQIFARLSPHAELRNEHRVGFADWARMWNLPHERWERIPPAPRLAERCVIELAPDREATARFWRTAERLADES